MQLEVFMKGQTAVPATLACDGNIVVREVSQAATNQQPTGDSRRPIVRRQARYQDAAYHTARGERDAARMSAMARPAATSSHSLRAAALRCSPNGRDGRPRQSHVERRARRSDRADGARSARQCVGDAHAGEDSLAERIAVRWPDDHVRPRMWLSPSADSTLHCDRMLARLAAPLQFGQHIDQTATSFSQIDCEGQVKIENVSRDTGGVTSHDRMQLRPSDDQSANGRHPRPRARRDSLDAVWDGAGTARRAAGR